MNTNELLDVQKAKVEKLEEEKAQLAAEAQGLKKSKKEEIKALHNELDKKVRELQNQVSVLEIENKKLNGTGGPQKKSTSCSIQ